MFKKALSLPNIMPVDAQIMPPSMLSKTAPLMPIKIPQILSMSMFKKQHH
jgi:hypothetical protein